MSNLKYTPQEYSTYHKVRDALEQMMSQSEIDKTKALLDVSMTHSYLMSSMIHHLVGEDELLRLNKSGYDDLTGYSFDYVRIASDYKLFVRFLRIKAFLTRLVSKIIPNSWINSYRKRRRDKVMNTKQRFKY